MVPMTAAAIGAFSAPRNAAKPSTITRKPKITSRSRFFSTIVVTAPC